MAVENKIHDENDAEIASIWYPINVTLGKRFNKFIELIEEHKIVQDILGIIVHDAPLQDAIRKLPAHVIDAVREEFPLTAKQLQLHEDASREAQLFMFDYDTC